MKSSVVTTSPDVMGGTPVFVGTRVPIENLFDCLESGETLDAFLRQFPTVTPEQALAVLQDRKKSCSPMNVLLDECVTRDLLDTMFFRSKMRDSKV